jgi:hypothetical protein
VHWYEMIADRMSYSALRMNDKTASIWSRLDIAYMSAICAPNADLETLKLMNDWNGWVFAFDDRKFLTDKQVVNQQNTPPHKLGELIKATIGPRRPCMHACIKSGDRTSANRATTNSFRRRVLRQQSHQSSRRSDLHSRYT